MQHVSNALLGKSDEIIDIHNHDDFFQILLLMSQQSRRNILIFSHSLDHRIYDNEDMYTALKELAIASRHTYIKILLQDAKPMTTRGHRLLELSRHLSSHVAIRLAAKEHKDILKTFILVDDCGFIIQDNPHRYDARCSFNAPLHARDLKEKFTDMWERGFEDNSLRRLGL